MPTRSQGDAPGSAITDLRLPRRAVTALARAGVTTADDLAVLSRRDLAAISGLGPGMIAAIRLVVPEPAAGTRAGTHSRTGRDDAVRPAAGPAPGSAEQESPAAPAIPSFASLRAPRRVSAVDLLVPGLPPAPPADPVPPAPRPAEYGDLLRIGTHVVRAAAGVPVRALRWSLREPVRCLRWLLGDRTPGPAD